MGNMDYSTIMKLSGHKTFSEFSKYISVNLKDVLKSRGLYSQDVKSDTMSEKLPKLFEKLSEGDKKNIFTLVESLSNK